MSATRRRRPQIEALEDRCFLDATPMTMTMTMTASGIIDPTFNPSDPSANSIQVTVTAVGEPVNGQILSITVTGLTPANLQPGSSYRLTIGGTSYTVSAVSPVSGGGYQLLFTTGLPSGQVSVGATGTVVIGGGATTPTTTTSSLSQSTSPIIDPTLNPTP